MACTGAGFNDMAIMMSLEAGPFYWWSSSLLYLPMMESWDNSSSPASKQHHTHPHFSLLSAAAAEYLRQWVSPSGLRLPNWERSSERLPYNCCTLTTNPDNTEYLVFTNPRLIPKKDILDPGWDLGSYLQCRTKGLVLFRYGTSCLTTVRKPTRTSGSGKSSPSPKGNRNCCSSLSFAFFSWQSNEDIISESTAHELKIQRNS